MIFFGKRIGRTNKVKIQPIQSTVNKLANFIMERSISHPFVCINFRRSSQIKHKFNINIIEAQESILVYVN